MVILPIVGVLSPALPDTVAIFAIAFAATMQSSGFQRVGKWSYTSVVTTANLRSLGETLFAIMFLPHNPEASDQARTLAAICAFFVCSAIAGATLTVIFGKSAIVFPIIFLSLAACPSSGRSVCAQKQALPLLAAPSLASLGACKFGSEGSHPFLAVETP